MMLHKQAKKREIRLKHGIATILCTTIPCILVCLIAKFHFLGTFDQFLTLIIVLVPSGKTDCYYHTTHDNIHFDFMVEKGGSLDIEFKAYNAETEEPIVQRKIYLIIDILYHFIKLHELQCEISNMELLNNISKPSKFNWISFFQSGTEEISQFQILFRQFVQFGIREEN